MAQTKSKKEVLDAELDKVRNGAFLREGQTIVSGEDAVKAAEKAQNIQTEGQSALMAGDVFTMPATLDELKKVMFAQRFSTSQENPSIGFVVVVERKGQPVAIRVFSTAFTRGIRPIVNGAESTEWRYPSGEPSKDVRDTNGSILEALAALCGKTIKVEAKTAVPCMRIKRGAVRKPDGTFDMEEGKQNMYTFSYVEEESTSSAADTTDDAA